MKVVGLLVILTIFVVSQSKWTASHAETSELIAATYKQAGDKLYTQWYHRTSCLSTFANQEVANALKADIAQTDDSKRTLTKIDNASVSQIYSCFGLKDPLADADKDGSLSGSELQSLNKIWQNFLPKWFMIWIT